MVGVHGGPSGAHYSGTERCASIWCCPVCSAVIRAERAAEVQEAVGVWLRGHNSLAFVTLTLRHRRGDPLAVTFDAALKAWRGLLSGRAWVEFRERFGVEGYVRSVEVTYGSNGWHPHVHVLFFVREPLSEADLREWEDTLYERWASLVVDHGARLPSRLRAVDVRAAGDDGAVAAQYLTKVQEHVSTERAKIGSEMARFDFKTGRGQSLMPFELLDDRAREEADDDNDAGRRLWTEFYRVTKGRRAITWSVGLRDALDLGAERGDQQIVDDAERRALRFLIPGEVYDAIGNEAATLALILELVEMGRTEVAVDYLDGRGGGERCRRPGASRRSIRARWAVPGRHLGLPSTEVIVPASCRTLLRFTNGTLQ
jgi:hypothetical protein